MKSIKTKVLFSKDFFFIDSSPRFFISYNQHRALQCATTHNISLRKRGCDINISHDFKSFFCSHLRWSDPETVSLLPLTTASINVTAKVQPKPFAYRLVMYYYSGGVSFQPFSRVRSSTRQQGVLPLSVCSAVCLSDTARLHKIEGKNPAYGRHWITRLMWIVALIPKNPDSKTKVAEFFFFFPAVILHLL